MDGVVETHTSKLPASSNCLSSVVVDIRETNITSCSVEVDLRETNVIKLWCQYDLASTSEAKRPNN